ncbi:hypothetical protein ACJJID_06895 [Microbulbifer sp. CnH-101-G]|uniref:hypothetical protein n=1 Tax=Microbulbifer sp. CnH-101-G TaxID=3243393 RepID=UPI00403A6CEA
MRTKRSSESVLPAAWLLRLIWSAKRLAIGVRKRPISANASFLYGMLPHKSANAAGLALAPSIIGTFSWRLAHLNLSFLSTFVYVVRGPHGRALQKQTVDPNDHQVSLTAGGITMFRLRESHCHGDSYSKSYNKPNNESCDQSYEYSGIYRCDYSLSYRSPMQPKISVKGELHQ